MTNITRKPHPEDTYAAILVDVLMNGVETYNERTKSTVRMKSNVCIEIDGAGPFPLLNARRTNWKGAIAEMLGYLRGCTDTEMFKALGTSTWEANANNPVWKASPFYGVYGDMGLIYGAVGNYVPKIEPPRFAPPDMHRYSCVGVIPVLKNLVDKLRARQDDRGLIWSFWNPGMFDLGCLRPCMHTHQFTIVGDRLDMLSTQRSADLALGTVYNVIQCYFLLHLMAKVAGLKPGKCLLTMANAHIYENQFEAVQKYLDNYANLTEEQRQYPALHLDDNRTYDYDFITKMTLDHIWVSEYDTSIVPVVKIPFTV